MVRTALALVLLSSSVAVVACSADGEETDTQDANATGGEKQDAASFLHVFAQGDAKPICAGAIIADTAAVVARSCVREGAMKVGLGARGDNPAGWNLAKVTRVHTPPTGPADIAVLEFDRKLGSSTALLTRSPLESGYTVFARQSVSAGLFFPAGKTTEMPATFQWMTDTRVTMQTKAGTKLCMRDLGAMVCSSHEATGLLGGGPRDRCGLAGIVIAPPDGGVLDGNDCSSEAWKVAPLGIYADFLKQFAPKIANPIVSSGIFGSSTYVPDGLWGYESAGTVKTCELTTGAMNPVKKNVKQPVRAKASFEGMGKRAEAVAHFGLAKASAPNTITWVPSTRGSNVTTAAFDDTFTTDIGAALDGEYIISLRVSANGGESWTRCDGIRPLTLSVGDNAVVPVVDAGAPPVDPPVVKVDAGTPPPPPPPPVDAGAPPPVTVDAGSPTNPPPATTDAGAAPQGDDDDDAPKPAEPAPGDDDDDDDTSETPKTPKKPKDNGSSGASSASPGGGDTVIPATTTVEDSGCSAAPGGNGQTRGHLPVIGLFFGLAALVRRRRRA